MTHSDTWQHDVSRSDHLAESLLSAQGLLVGFDFDGTLSPIVDDPDNAILPDAVEHSVRTLARRDNVRVAIVSGRELTDLVERINISDIIYAGNHGLELYRDGEHTVQGVTEQHLSSLHAIRTDLRSKVTDIPGCHIEDKELSITVHVRQAEPDHVEEVRDSVVETTTETPDVHLTTGRQVFEIRPSVDHDKGTTMELLENEIPAEWLTLYLGDDVTDEDAFEAIQPDGVGIHVGANTNTAAEYLIPNHQDVSVFLNWLTDTAVDND